MNWGRKKKEFACPEAIIFYNKYMSRVDSSDQMATLYELLSYSLWNRLFDQSRKVKLSTKENEIFQTAFQDFKVDFKCNWLYSNEIKELQKLY